MNSNKTRLAFAVMTIALVFAILSLIFWDFVRETIVVPIYYLIWVGTLILKSIPQAAYLVLLILISLAIGTNALRNIRVRPIVQHHPQNYSKTSTRYWFWRKLLTYFNRSQVSWDSFAWEARKLTLSILAYQEGLDISQVEAMAVNGALDVPDSVKDLIQRQGIQISKPQPRAIERIILRLRHLLFKEESSIDPQISLMADEIVGFIEYRLEITHAGNQRESRT